MRTILLNILAALFTSNRFLFAFVLALLAGVAFVGMTFGQTKARLRSCFSRGNLSRLLDNGLSGDFGVAALLFGAGFWIGDHYAFVGLGSRQAVFFTPSSDIVRQPYWAYGLLIACAGALSFGLFRTVMGRWTAACASLLFITSPFQLYVLVSSPIRDYLRVPFVLAMLLALARVVKGGLSFRGVLWISSIVGLVLGVGLHVREEISTFVLLAVLSIVFLSPYRPPGAWKMKLGGLLALLVCFWATVPLPLITFNTTSTTAGFMSPLDGPLGLSRPPYDAGYLFLDEFIAATNNVVESQGKSFVGAYLRNRPADFLIRVYAAAKRILAFPFRYQLPPQGGTGRPTLWFYQVRAELQSLLAGQEIGLYAAALLILAASNLRLAVFQLVLLFYFSAMFTVQFWGKNYFYMEFLSWWNVGIAAEGVGILFRGMAKQGPSYLRSWGKAHGVRTAVIAAAVGAALVAPLSALRAYQTRVLENLFRDYRISERETAALSAPTFLNGVAMWKANPRRTTQEGFLAGGAEFWAAELGGEGCPVSLSPVLRYHPRPGSIGRRDWSRTLSVSRRTEREIASVFFPAWPESFSAIELPSDQANCLRDWRRIRNPSRFPMLLTVVESEGAVAPPLYQQLEEAVRSVRTSAVDDSMQVSPILPDQAEFSAVIVSWEGPVLRVAGYALPPLDPHVDPKADRSRSRLGQAWSEDVNVAEVDTDLFITKDKWLRKGSYVRLEGILQTGGFSAGLVRDRHSAGSVSFHTPGPFTAVLEAPVDGHYSFGLANSLFWYTSVENRFVVRRLTWVEKTEATHASALQQHDGEEIRRNLRGRY